MFLKQVYKELDYNSDGLIDIEIPRNVLGEQDYLSKGQWVDICSTINGKTTEFSIDRVFFVQENPVVVFVDASKKQKGEIFKIFNSIWSLARPRIVFIENDTTISVYDLASDPAKSDDDLNPLVEILKESKQILQKLKEFDRESVESFENFRNERFNKVKNRADQKLISDLKQVRKKLFECGLNGDKLKYAHSLIGRSIFIRYLEDKGVLTKDYFKAIVKDNPKELKIIETPLTVSFYRDEMKELIYPRILANKNLTFKLFKKIAEDFNGDTFSTDPAEERIVQQSHLNLLQNFLIGDGNSHQLSLFLWAYRFDVIPIDLISSIYEEFYHSENLIDEKTKALKDGGTHYTPSSLVEFVLSRTLTVDILRNNPKVLDPACGSGIFLVESYRRLIRYKLYQNNSDSLSLEELLQILKEQIAGIEINSEAIKIAAFSLYLSVLNYLDTPNILNYIKKGGKLPHLINHGKGKENHFNILLKSNAFSQKTSKVFGTTSFDVIVGNPPWGTPSTKNIEARKELEVIVKWCKNEGLEFPDKEPSHAFLLRALEFLKPHGLCSLLVSSGVLLKFSHRSNNYKQRILNATTFKEVVNFSHVRRIFFSDANSPFLMLKIQKTSPSLDTTISYISIQRSRSIEENKVVLIDEGDYKRIKQVNTHINDIWKIYYWGNDYDFNLIHSIRRFQALKSYVDLNNSGQGFKEANKSKSPEWLAKFKEIPVSCFKSPFQSFNFNDSKDVNKKQDIPPWIERRGSQELYRGKRILIRRGIIQKNVNPKGQIIARLETEEFAFKNSINCIKLDKDFEDYYDVIIGIFWSSLFRYFMFMTASTWGTWRQEIHLNEVLEFPIAIPETSLKEKISNLVHQIREKSKSIDLFKTTQIIDHELLNLNSMIFDLYELTDFERTLIADRCDFTIDYYYNREKSTGEQQIRDSDLNYLRSYINKFNGYWRSKLDDRETFRPTILTSEDWSVIGIAFRLDKKRGTKNEDSEILSTMYLSEFPDLVTRRKAKNVYSEGVFRRITEKDQIIIIKRNRKSNWTRTEAKTDVDAVCLQILNNSTNQ